MIEIKFRAWDKIEKLVDMPIIRRIMVKFNRPTKLKPLKYEPCEFEKNNICYALICYTSQKCKAKDKDGKIRYADTDEIVDDMNIRRIKLTYR